MKQFNEMDHIEMLEREVIHWKCEEEARRGELLSFKALNDTVEAEKELINTVLTKTSESLKKKKEELNEANKIRGDLKLQLMDKNDKHNEEMKVMYDKLHEMENRWAQAVSTASEEREIRKSYKKDLQALVREVTKSALESHKAKLTLISTTRQKRHILRAFNDKSKEVTDLKKRVRQLERERDGLLESVNMLSSHAMEKMKKAVLSKENFESANKDIMYSAKPNEIPHALQKIEKLYKTDFKIYDISSSGELWSGFKRVVFYTTDTPNVSALRERIEKEYVSFFPQQEIEHTGTIVHNNPLFVFEKMSRGEVMNESVDKNVLIYRNAVIMGSGFVYDGQPLKLFTFESLNGD